MTDALEQIARLEHDWDTYGSPPIPAEVIEYGRRILQCVDILGATRPHISPVPGGGLNFEWEEKAFALEVEVTPMREVAILIVDKELGSSMEVTIVRRDGD